MSQPNIATRARTILAEHFDRPVEEIIDTARLQEDLDADSLDNIEIVMAVEEEFDLEIGDDEAERWRTVGDVIQTVDAKLAEAA